VINSRKYCYCQLSSTDDGPIGTKFQKENLYFWNYPNFLVTLQNRSKEASTPKKTARSIQPFWQNRTQTPVRDRQPRRTDRQMAIASTALARCRAGKTPILKIAPTTLWLFRLSYPSRSSGWLGSRVVGVLDSRAKEPGFKSQLRRCRMTVLGKLFTPIMPLFTKQRNW